MTLYIGSYAAAQESGAMTGGFQSLAPYLCGGWADPYADHPYRYTTPSSIDDPSWSAGYWDMGTHLLFTGTLVWDPEDWWATPPVEAVLGGSPDVGLDALDLISAGRDGLRNLTDEPNDQGALLPFAVPSQQILLFPLVFAGLGGGTERSGWWQAFASSGVGSGINIKTGDRGNVRSAGRVTDSAGFTHSSLPAGTQISLSGITIAIKGD